MSQDDHTFLFADIAGFTALTEAHGDEHAADAVEAFCATADEMRGRYAAEHVKSIGDAVLLRTQDAGAAVQMALGIVDELAGRHGVPLVRAGMHTGPAVRRGADWYGATVNLASRVTAAARAGEVLLSETTARALPGLEDVALEDRGLHRFRNVAVPARVYLARRAGLRPRVLPVDPVCHMAVDPDQARRVEELGREVYVCSQDCEERFRADPGAYDHIAGA